MDTHINTLLCEWMVSGGNCCLLVCFLSSCSINATPSEKVDWLTKTKACCPLWKGQKVIDFGLVPVGHSLPALQLKFCTCNWLRTASTGAIMWEVAWQFHRIFFFCVAVSTHHFPFCPSLAVSTYLTCLISLFLLILLPDCPYFIPCLRYLYQLKCPNSCILSYIFCTGGKICAGGLELQRRCLMCFPTLHSALHIPD